MGGGGDFGVLLFFQEFVKWNLSYWRCLPGVVKINETGKNKILQDQLL